MKKLFLILLITSSIFYYGCIKGCQKNIRHMKSNAIGLKRKVTLCNYNGETIRTWTGRLQIEIQSNGVLSWIGNNNKEVKIIGGIVIIEEI